MGGAKRPDGVESYTASAEQLATYDHAQEQLAAFATPRLVSRDRPDERMFVASFDGTGNSWINDAPENRTNVSYIHEQVTDRSREDVKSLGYAPVVSGYVEGVGTQGGIAGVRDSIRGETYNSRLEDMYHQFVMQAKVWVDQNPGANIRLAAVGFSRGAEQTAGFTRMVEARGIKDPTNAIIHRDARGLIERVDYADAPPLRAPGTVVQAAMLYDPVGTGTPRDHDRRLAPSVVTGFQITAEHERRNLFQGTRILDPGVTSDGRFLNVSVVGAHSNIGGSYTLDGLSIRSGNLGADFINSLSDRPLVEKREEPTDPARNVIHRSEDHQFFYRTSEFDRTGQRAHQEKLAPANLCAMDCRDAMPRNEAMAAGLEWRPVQIGPVPGASVDVDREQPSSAGTNADFVARLFAAVREGDDQGIRAITLDQLDSVQGQAWLQRGTAQFHDAQAHAVERAMERGEGITQPELSR